MIGHHLAVAFSGYVLGTTAGLNPLLTLLVGGFIGFVGGTKAPTTTK